MKREYMMRGQRVAIDELDGVVAVKPAKREESGEEAFRAFGTAASLKTAEIAEGDWGPFEKAGWRLMRPNAQLAAAMQARSMPDGPDEARRVFRHPSGRIYLGSNRLTVKLRADLPESNVNAKLAAAGLETVRRLGFAPNLFEVKVAAGRDFLDVSMALGSDKDFVYAEPQFIEHIPGRFVPTDPDYGQQWHLENTGQDGGTAGADISAQDAWNMTRGLGVRVAVIDNGIDVNHPDLSAAIAARSGFFQAGGAFVQGVAGFPNGNHGTFCSGMALARANNAEGVVGVANQAEFLAIACLVDQLGDQATLARAVAYAADPRQETPAAGADEGADVISCSLGPNNAPWPMTQVLQDAIDFAVTNGRGGLGTPIFWASDNGNVPLNQDEVVSYANTIAVGRSTRNDLEDNSAHGPELDFLATGVDVHSTNSGGGYGDSTGTSFAAPTAAGVGALVVAVNPNLTWQQVRQTMRDTCDKIGGAVYDGTGHSDDYGFGRVNAARAVCTAGRVVELLTPSVTFNDVPESEPTARAVVFSVITCQTATFQIVAGPTVTSGPGSFGTLPSPNAALPAAMNLSTREARLWLSFTGTNDGDIASGEVTVRLVETGQEWVIPISANTIARPTVAALMVLDQSGSMQSPSGLAGFATRNDVLKFSAPVFVNLIQENNGIGIAAFDHDPYTRMNVQTVGAPGPFDPVRATALGAIAAHTPNPAGLTAIGDGVERAKDLLDAAPGYDQKATIVFTDGFETDAKYISDVAGLINDRVFAIGLGTADQIQPAALTALTNGTGGYLLLTGALGPDDTFRLAKYYLQILAGVTNQDIVLDPEGSIKPGQKHRIPFHLNETDIGVDSILLSQANTPVLRYALETPAGDLIDPVLAGATPSISYTAAQGVSFYRMTLPVPLGVGAKAGKWHAVLTVDPTYYKRYLASLDNQKELYQQVAAHGVRYSLSVHSYSGLRMQGRVTQNSNEPGATMAVRAVLTEYGLPIGGNRATVRAEFERPDGTKGVLAMPETDPGSGIFQAALGAPLNGVYRFRMLGDGKTLRGRPFTREQLLTGAVWKGGDNPPPTSKDDPNTAKDDLCRLLNCLLGEKTIRPEFQKRLLELGIDLDSARACLRAWCRRPPVRPVSPGSITVGTVPVSGTLLTPAVSTVPALAISSEAADLIRQLALELDR